MNIANSIRYDKAQLSDTQLLDLYKNLLKPRLVEEKMLIRLRQGKISKWFSGIGQEAISVGCTAAMKSQEVVFPMHRNLGVFTTRNVPLERLFCQWQGKMLGFTKGRDRSFHFGAMDYNIVGMISHLGPQLSLSSGVALAHTLKEEQNCSLVFTGEGGTSQGEFHEALNVASVWQLPVIFVIENNGYGLSTPVSEQYRCEKLSDRGVGYGMRAMTIDGNNVLEVYNTISKLTEEIRKNPEPILVECQTFRMRGHEEASGVKYVPKELMEEWAQKDPLKNFETYLLEQGLLTESTIAQLTKEIKQEINDALEIADNEPKVNVETHYELMDVFANHKSVDTTPKNKSISEKRFVDAISDGLNLAMEHHEDLVLMGQDIADYGGVFKITDGFLEKYGRQRVRNTPLCESAILGIALGLSIKGIKSMVEMQFADFVTCGFNQIVNNHAKAHYRWGQKSNTVIRMPAGAGVAAGPYHSQTNEAWFTHTPGLKVVFPSSPYDAKGMLLAAFEDPNPVLFFEHKALYRSLSEEIPDGYYTVALGKAKVVRPGQDVSIITYGMGVHWAKEIVAELEADAEILDLRTLSPLDWEAIEDSVMRTGKVLVLHEDIMQGGIGADISAYINEHLFQQLDAPVMRCASLNTPVPFDAELEKNFLPKDRFRKKLQELLAY